MLLFSVFHSPFENLPRLSFFALSQRDSLQAEQRNKKHPMAKRRAEYLQEEMARGFKRPRGRPPTNATLQRDGSSSVYILNGMTATLEAVTAAREAR